MWKQQVENGSAAPPTAEGSGGHRLLAVARASVGTGIVGSSRRLSNLRRSVTPQSPVGHYGSQGSPNKDQEAPEGIELCDVVVESKMAATSPFNLTVSTPSPSNSWNKGSPTDVRIESPLMVATRLRSESQSNSARLLPSKPFQLPESADSRRKSESAVSDMSTRTQSFRS